MQGFLATAAEDNATNDFYNESVLLLWSTHQKMLHISQSSVAMQFKWGGMFNESLLQIHCRLAPVKEFLKSVNTWCSYDKN